MNWIKENKFLFGFGVATGLSTLALGFFVFQAKSSYDEALSAYTEQAAELSRLQHLPIFPNQKNLDALGAQKKQMTEAVTGLAKSLAALQIAPEEISPYQFQDKLKAAVSAIVTKAGSNVKLPEKFFLGFEKYETTPPENGAAVQLGRQLKAIDWVVNQLLDNRITELKELKREELPEEKGANSKAPEPGKGSGGRGDKPAANNAVIKHPFTVTFVADQAIFREALNKITSSSTQFYIPRLITVKNTAEKGPSRTVAFTPPAGAAAGLNPDGTPAAIAAAAPAPAAPASQYIVGEEKVEVTLVLETADFGAADAK